MKRTGISVEYERELVQAFRDGDRQGFRTLFEIHQDSVYRLCRQYTRSPEDAEDLSQEIWIRVFKHLAAFRGESSLSTWLFRLTVNACLNHCRARQRDETHVHDSPVEPVDPRSDPAASYERNTISEVMRQAIDMLPEPLKLVFVLNAIDGRSYADTAEILNLSIDAVRMRMSRARRLLRDRLTPLMKEGIA